MNKEYLRQQWESMSEIIHPQEFAFFRDDDIGFENKEFIYFSKNFENNNISLNIAVIPDQIKNMTDEFKRGLSKDIFTIFQHGNKHHINYTTTSDSSNKSTTSAVRDISIIGEFHTSLDDNVAEQNLIEGWNLLESNINTQFKGFIPPWHSFPDITLLLKNNYEIISGYGNIIELIKKKIVSVPTNLDIIKNYSRKECYSLKDIIGRSEELLKNTGYVGVLLHHNFMKNEESKLINQIAEYFHKNNIPIISLEATLKWKIN